MCDIIPQAEFLGTKIDEKRCLANPGKLSRTLGRIFRPRGHICHGFIFSSWFSKPRPWKRTLLPGVFLLGVCYNQNGG